MKYMEFLGKTLEEGINGKLGTEKPDIPAILKVWCMAFDISHRWTICAGPPYVSSAAVLLLLLPPLRVQLPVHLAWPDQPCL